MEQLNKGKIHGQGKDHREGHQDDLVAAAQQVAHDAHDDNGRDDKADAGHQDVPGQQKQGHQYHADIADFFLLLLGSGGLGGLVGGAAGGVGGHIYSSSVSKGGSFANNVIGSVATGNITQMGTITGEKAVEALHSYMGHTALGAGAENIPTYQNVEIGGGRITGTEVTPEHPEGIAFGMYHADQYVAPEGQYTTVHAVDGTAWYKQYAVDAVDKTPYMAPDGSIAYNESIVKKLPPTPKRKDKI